MSKSSGAGLFGVRRAGAVAIVEAPVSRAYARKARITFYVVAVAVALVVMVVAHHRPAGFAVIVGLVLGVVAGLVAGAGVVVWPVARVLWHWAAEITLALVLLVCWAWLAALTSGPFALLILAGLVAVVVGVPVARRPVVAVVWCAVVRHRLRTCFAEFLRTPGQTNPGRSPLVLVARPTPAGERVWVWLRPGLELADLEGRCGKLAVACWADQVTVVRASRSYAALIRVDVTRRDPLRTSVASPLLGWVPDSWLHRAAPVSPAVPAGLDLSDIPEPADTPAPQRPSRSRRTPPAVDVDDNPFI